jgi:hypothetical protein
MIIWRIRDISTGLYWNDVRWAPLHGHFEEQGAVQLPNNQEMVKLKISAPPPVQHTPAKTLRQKSVKVLKGLGET